MTGGPYRASFARTRTDLRTILATRLLAAADIVLHDTLIDDDVLALAPRAENVAVGERCGAEPAIDGYRRVAAG